jgi:hypothetical protein
VNRETQIFGLELGDAEAKPQSIVTVKMYGDPDDLVAGRDGFWLAVSDMSRGVCGSSVVWLKRDAKRAIPVSGPACVFGPKRAEGEAEAVWATSKTYSDSMQIVVAKGPPPGGLAPLPRRLDGAFDAVVHGSDGVYMALDEGEVIRRRPDGTEGRVARPLLHQQSRAVAVHGDHVYLASSDDRHKVELFRIPRAGGERTLIGKFDVQTSVTHLQASDSGVLLDRPGDRNADRLLLIDPTGGCPNVELPTPSMQGRFLLDRDVVYMLRDEGIVAISFAGRARAASATPPAAAEGASARTAEQLACRAAHHRASEQSAPPRRRHSCSSQRRSTLEARSRLLSTTSSGAPATRCASSTAQITHSQMSWCGLPNTPPPIIVSTTLPLPRSSAARSVPR